MHYASMQTLALQRCLELEFRLQFWHVFILSGKPCAYISNCMHLDLYTEKGNFFCHIGFYAKNDYLVQGLVIHEI